MGTENQEIKKPTTGFAVDWSSIIFLGLLLLALVGILLAVFVETGKAPSPAHILTVWPPLNDWPMALTIGSVAFYVLCVTIAWGIAKRMAVGCDPVIFVAGATLAGLGYVLLIRLSPDIAVVRHREVLSHLAGKQFVYLLLSLIAFLGGVWSARPAILQKLARRRYWFAVLAMLLIAVTGLFGQEINGRKLWLPLGPVQFQTVELVKVLVILFAASFFVDRSGFVGGQSATAKWKGLRLHVLGPFAVTALLFLLPVIFQGDLGPALLLSLFMLVMFYVAGNGLFWPIAGACVLVGASYAAYSFGWPSMVRTRFDMWLDPFHHSEVLSQSLWALESGGLLGSGLGQGWSARIPIVQSDFNFVAICEELGWIGGVSLISLYAVVMCRGFRVAEVQSNPYARYLAAGISCMLVIQALIIIGGNMALLPLTGITLPFVSYGGSSLLVSFYLLGVLAQCSGKSSWTV